MCSTEVTLPVGNPQDGHCVQVTSLPKGQDMMNAATRRTTMLLVALAAATTLLTGCAGDPAVEVAPDPSPTPAVTPPPTAESTPDRRRDAAPGGGAARCVEQYLPRAVDRRAFAFDGTVSDIAPTPAGDRRDLGYVAVTFTVNEWFHGGQTDTVTVDMASPDAVLSETAVSGGSYEIGSRLLVSGEPRWGGQPLDDAVAWGCGFTRQYDPGTADRWRTAGK